MTLIDAINIRKSCRTYSDKAIEPDKLSELRQFLTSNTETPFGSNVSFRFMDCNEVEIAELKKLTTYGVIKGTRRYSRIGNKQRRVTPCYLISLAQFMPRDSRKRSS